MEISGPISTTLSPCELAILKPSQVAVIIELPCQLSGNEKLNLY